MYPDRTMLRTVLLAIVLLTPPASAGAAQRTGGYVVDLSAATVSFTMQMLGVFDVRGVFEEVSGDLLVGGQSAISGVDFTVATASVNTDNRLRDEVARSPALLNSRHHPQIVFRSTRIDAGPEGPRRIVGLLSIKDNTREVSFEVVRDGAPAIAPQLAGRYRAATRISRADFRIETPLPGLSDTVSIEVAMDIRPEMLRLAAADRVEERP
jgi:polyisoprenoid-binding protein YceI